MNRCALRVDSLFSPCCRGWDIPLDMVRWIMGEDFIRQYREKALELAALNRIYCHQPTCSAFIPLSRITTGIISCPTCSMQTCTTCKMGAHEHRQCPTDTGLQQVLEIALQEEWRRCPKCFTMIELRIGCYHMTCTCQAEFCSLRESHWKTCQCPHFDEDMLNARARNIYNREQNVSEDHQRFVAGGVGQIVHELQEYHECDYSGQRRHWFGQYQCEMCHEYLPNFILECVHCRLLSCY
ncbi:hypothetical protein F4777DRAFT_588353 [Nemania sp. FL0916]|nr:hypothetical protein F4777DRAFT_588353 [Nemania sp. FL0916]